MFDDDDAQTPDADEEEGLPLERLKSMWREAVDDYSEARAQHYRDEEYYDGDVKGTGWGQWTQDELVKLGQRNQPPTTRNHIERKVNAIAGVEQRARSEPRALPRTPKDQQAAEIATDSLRYVAERARWSNIKSDAFMESLKVGFAAVEIGGAEDCVPITPIDWKDFFADPRSRRPGYSDARYLGTAKWLDADVAEATYAPPEPEQPQIPPQPQDPDQLQDWARYAQSLIDQYNHELAERERIVEAIKSTQEAGGLDSSDHADRPNSVFGDRKRRRIFVVDMWYRDAKTGWMRCVFTGNGKLFCEAAKYEETDDWGRKIKTHPIKAFALFVSRDLWRYGVVRGMRSPQDEINFRLSKMLHWLMVNQLFYEPGALGETDRETARAELAKPDGVIPVGNLAGIKVERGLDVAVALGRAGEDARQFMEMGGPNPQLQGEQGRATSGRAVLALQQAGLGQLGPIFDRLYDWELRCYRAMWCRVQQFWKAPMYVRVTDDKNAARFAAVNGAPVIHQGNGNTPDADEQQIPAMPGMGGGMQPGMMAPDDPRMGIGANGGPMMTPEDMGETGPMLAELDMDIIIDRAPEAATLQAEQFEELVKLGQAGMLGPPGNPDMARLFITASALPTKTQLLDMLDKMQAKPQGPSPQEKAMLEKLAAEIEKTMAMRDQAQATAAKTYAEIPGVIAQNEQARAEARNKSIETTMSEFGAAQAMAPLGASAPGNGSPSLDPLVAADQPGAIGLPPQQANGPPPF